VNMKILPNSSKEIDTQLAPWWVPETLEHLYQRTWLSDREYLEKPAVLAEHVYRMYVVI
jgi:hypothetical protein